MRHYEVVFLVHPKQSAQIPKMIQKYKSIIESSNGKMHRLEDWGLRTLAYPINKSNEAHYVLMNIECTHEVRKEITDSFHFSSAILRSLILKQEEPILKPSPVVQVMAKAKADEEAKKLKQRKEQISLLNADTEKTSPLKSNEENTNKKNPVAKEKTAKQIEDTTKQDKGKSQELKKDDTGIVKNETENTTTYDKDVESTKE